MIITYLILINIIFAHGTLKDDVNKWYDFVSNPKNRCAPNPHDEKNTLVHENYKYGLFETLLNDCSKDNGYSLNYKLDMGKKLKKKTLNGEGTIAFNTNTNHGFRTGVCVRTLSSDVNRIDATFEANEIQGYFKVYFKGETTMDGYARDSKIISPVRYFVREKLVNVTSNKNNWIKKFDYHSFINDAVHDHIIGLDGKDVQVICDNNGYSNYILNKCEETSYMFQSNSCHYNIQINKSESKPSRNFRWNRLRDERHYNGEDDFVDCSKQWITGSEAKKVIKSWFDKLQKLTPDPYWKSQPFSNPIDETEDKPSIYVKVPEWNRSYLNVNFTAKDLVEDYGTQTNIDGELIFKLNTTKFSKKNIQNYMFIVSKMRFDESTFHIVYEIEDHAVEKLKELLDSKLVILGHIKGGRYHGIVRRFGRLVSGSNSNCAKKIFAGLAFIGRYDNGIPVGPSWRVVPGGGLLYGDINGAEFTGDNLAYIYPDLDTVIIGKFKKGILIEGKEATLTGVRCVNGIYEARFSEPEGPSYHYLPATNETYGDQPMLTDPLDKKYYYLKKSNVDHELADQGVFASRDIEEGTIFALYNGLSLNSENLTCLIKSILMKARRKVLRIPLRNISDT
ncbi:uncharacterized protein [Lepeophtheirus salmonis]|uniref:uncharacterized protein n=1 Tax=Lepeophtheirus salmonis TaxID=72036 RepID=UPI001AE3030E|nr:uncharacterized protein LOC121117501 [Lepeophtheirus salmonis]